MSWDALGAIAEAIGAIGMLASIVYLAIQIRGSNRVARGDSETQFQIYWNATVQQRWLGDRERASLFRRAMADWSALDGLDQSVAHTLFADAVDAQRIAQRLNASGQIADDLAWAVDLSVGSLVKTPGGRAWWEQVQHYYIHRDAIDELIANPEIPSALEVPFFRVEG